MASKAEDNIEISVVYAEEERQQVIRLSCSPDTTIRKAIEMSGIRDRVPALRESDLDVGVYGYRQDLDYVLEENDRVEIYRPLIVSPTEARRLRAKSGKKQ